MQGTILLCALVGIVWMFSPLLVLGCAIAIALWLQYKKHPEKFPPGPRFPLPLIGDGYILGRDMADGNANNEKK